MGLVGIFCVFTNVILLALFGHLWTRYCKVYDQMIKYKVRLMKVDKELEEN